MKVITCCRSRFYIFEQAVQLYKHGYLHKLIADYPIRFIQNRTFLPREYINNMPVNGMFNHSYTRIRNCLPHSIAEKIDEYTHSIFSRLVANKIDYSADFFIAMSSFALDGIRISRSRSVKSIVDHASLHQADNRKFVEIEASRWKVIVPNSFAAEWVIKKEDEEFRECDYIFVPSSVAKRSMIDNGVDQSKIFINPYGVDLKYFKQTNKSNEHEFNVVQVGAISLNKGTLSLIDAFNECRFKNSRLYLAGNKASEKIDDLLNKLCNDSVSILGSLQLSKLVELYSVSHVAVLNSVSDGFALVVPQALAMGLPVICTDNVGAKDLIIDGYNGFVIPTFQPKALIEKLKELYDNPELLRKMSLNARKSIEMDVSWDSYGDRLAGILESIK